MYTLEVNFEYHVNLICFFHKRKSRWVLEYNLPTETKKRTILTLPKGISESKARSMGKAKELDLMRGKFTEKEYKKICEKNDSGHSWTIEKGVEEYISTTAVFKSLKQRDKEKYEIPNRFRFFTETCKLKMLHQIKKSHVLDCKNDFTKKISTEELAPTTAQAGFATVQKVLKWLWENEKILSHPGKDIKPIKIATKDKARTNTFTPEQVLAVMNADFHPKLDFPIKAYFLFAKETGARIGEILHLEWGDIVNGIWYIKSKPKCPTRLGKGWSPKWGKERPIVLTPAALGVLEMLPKVSSVGYIKGEDSPVPANFVFVVKDRKVEGGFRRVDDIDRSWQGLMKAAGLPDTGPEAFVRHDLRRTCNEEKKRQGISDEQRAKELGHSVKVNLSNYTGEFNPELEKMFAIFRSSQGENLLEILKKEASNEK